MKEHAITKVMVKIFLRNVFYRVRFKNEEILQEVKRCVICANHTTVFDPMWIHNKALKMYIMGKKELFNNKIMARIWKHYNVFPVDREKIDVKSTLKAASIFEENKGDVQLMIFPEGKVIKKESEIGVVKNGAVFTAANAEVPIVPIHITRRPKLFSKVIIEVGKPIKIDKKVLESKEKIREASKMVLQKIYDMEGLKVYKDEGKND